MAIITIPNNWSPRDYQLDCLIAFDKGIRRQYHIWHRRAGKDSFALNLAAKMAHEEVGTYWHLLPKQTQARKAIWHGIGKDGIRFIDQAFPPPIRRRTSGQEMLIEFKNGSTWQLNGSDTYDTLVGSNVKGVVFSEWALCDPAAWDYIRPIIRENNGWAIFITTYRGKNHAYKQFNKLKNNPDWFVSLKTIDDTGVLTKEDMNKERAEGMSEGMIQQEYYCSPMAAYEGAYWANEMNDLKNNDRLTTVEYEPALPVIASFDLGMDDSTTCIMIQESGNQPRIIGSRAWRRTSIPRICQDLKETFPWTIDTILLPHDGEVQEMGTGLKRSDIFREAMPRTIVEIVKQQGPIKGRRNGIEAARLLLPKVWIDYVPRPWTNGEENNFTLVEALTSYRTEPSKQDPSVFNLNPLHDWSSHWADAFRYYAVHRQSGIIGDGWDDSIDYSWHDKAIV